MTLDIKEMNRKLIDLLGIDNSYLKDKDRRYASVGIDDPKKIGYFTQKKIDQLSAKATPEIIQEFGNSSVYNEKLRQKHAIIGKPGKFFKHLFPNYNNNDIISLVSEWYSIIGENDTNGFNFEITNEIVKYYHKNNYFYSSGTLGDSCMKYSECQDYIQFYDYYNTSLLILKGDSDLIIGRALLWHDTYFKKIDKRLTFMDRIYVNNDNDITRFINYAKKNNFAYKERQSYDYKVEFVYNLESFNDSIKIDPVQDFDLDDITYPYVDTLSYMNGSRQLSNTYDFHGISLESTDGCSSLDENMSECEDCGERFDSDDNGAYIEDYGYVCDNCLNNDYINCNCCNSFVDNNETVEIVKDAGCSFYVCQSCADNEYYRCSVCDEYRENDETYSNENGESFCQECYHDRYTTCSECGEEIEQDSDYEHYCPICYNDKFSECSECQGDFPNEDTEINDNGDVLCQECYNEYNEYIETEKEGV